MKIAFVSVTRFDTIFLNMWVKHHEQFADRRNMFILIHGTDALSTNAPTGVNYILHDRPENPDRVAAHSYTSVEQSKLASHLIELGYDAVIRLDIDEFVVPDPAANLSLEDIVADNKPKGIVHFLGIDVFHRLGQERTITDDDDYILQVHTHGVISRAYSKPGLVYKPVSWPMGNHRVRKSSNHMIDPRLVLFHLALADNQLAQARFDEVYKGQDQHTMDHLQKRESMMRSSADVTPADFEETKLIAINEMAPQTPDFLKENKTRFAQNPTFSDGYYVQIPDRFRQLIRL